MILIKENIRIETDKKEFRNVELRRYEEVASVIGRECIENPKPQGKRKRNLKLLRTSCERKEHRRLERREKIGMQKVKNILTSTKQEIRNG